MPNAPVSAGTLRLAAGAVLIGAALALSPLIEASPEAPLPEPDAAAMPADGPLQPSPADGASREAALPPEAPRAIPPSFDAGISGALMASQALPGGPTAWRTQGPVDGWSWHPLDPAHEGTLRVPASSREGRLAAPELPGAYRLGQGEAAPADGPVLLVMVPFDAKQRGRIDGYVMGSWPGEGGSSSPYILPQGFVRMTEAMVDIPLSPRLKLGNFKTKNQQSVWPKYLALDLKLVDKLELIAADLRAQGLPGNQLFVMSGFRTPSYNAPGVGAGGRAKFSRHQFGDAADVWVDDDGNGRMDDLNGDGRSDTADARVMLAAQERVEARWPELIGGGGVYQSTSAHGPFLHVDVRGSVARWGQL